MELHHECTIALCCLESQTRISNNCSWHLCFESVPLILQSIFELKGFLGIHLHVSEVHMPFGMPSLQFLQTRQYQLSNQLLSKLFECGSSLIKLQMEWCCRYCISLPNAEFTLLYAIYLQTYFITLYFPQTPKATVIAVTMRSCRKLWQAGTNSLLTWRRLEIWPISLLRNDAIVSNARANLWSKNNRYEN